MRKQVTASAPRVPQAPAADQPWLDLEGIAVVEVTSEENGFPIEAALLPGKDQGWRAAVPGAQTVRLYFDQPQTLTRISLAFEERQIPRMQEFALRYTSSGGNLLRDIVRQQWNFNPTNAAREVENYAVELAEVTSVELTIVPDTSGGSAHASLLSMRLAG
jgi:hypothetical protein